MKRTMRRLHAEFGEKEFIVEFKKKAVARWNIADPAAALRDLEERERGISMSLPAPSSPLNMRHGD